MKKAFKNIAGKVHGYFARCRRCGYSGGGWPDSGECPSCGEVN